MNILPRSRLYSLGPLHPAGFGWSESATCLVSRLALEHCVSVQEIISNEILPLQGESREYIAQRKYSSIIFLLNGMGTFAKKWINTIEYLTGKENLRFSTLLNWEGVIRPNDLLRKYKTWCPKCLEEWKAADHISYEPLLWSLKQTMVCPIHNIYLSEKCPNFGCNKPIPVLGSNSRASFCSYCDSWLGKVMNNDRSASHEDIWITAVLLEMLSYNHDTSKITIDIDGRRALKFFGREGAFSQASSEFMASIFGVHPTTINRWKRGENPTLSILLKGCYLLQRSPFSLSSDALDKEAINEFIAETVQLTEIEANILNLCQNDELEFLKKYRSRLISSTSIGDFCRRIKVRESVMLTRAPNFQDLIVKSIRKRKAAKEKNCRESLKSIISRDDEIPPTLSDAAKEIGIPIRTLRKYAPSICKAIAKRRIEFDASVALQKEEIMVQRVYKTTKELLENGLEPTPMRISPSLPHAAYLQNPKIRDSIKQAAADFYKTHAR